MRINGFTQIKAFYSWVFDNQNLNIKPQHISLYLFLLNQNNRVNWVEWFKCPFDLAMYGSCISSKKTYYSCLNDLTEWKMIQHKKGVNKWKAPLIKLEVLKDTATVPQSEPQPTQVVEPLAILLPTHIYKLITDNHKQIVSVLEKWDLERILPKDEKPIITDYSKHLFLEDWNKLRKEHLKLPSHLNGISNYDEAEFKLLKKSNTREDFQFAMIGLFKQKVLPNGNTSMQSNPTHFFKSFNSYLTAYHDKNNSLYGKKSQEI